MNVPVNEIEQMLEEANDPLSGGSIWGPHEPETLCVRALVSSSLALLLSEREGTNTTVGLLSDVAEWYTSTIGHLQNPTDIASLNYDVFSFS